MDNDVMVAWAIKSKWHQTHTRIRSHRSDGLGRNRLNESVVIANSVMVIGYSRTMVNVSNL